MSNITLRKLQVFVSSTYEDLKHERQSAVMAILKANHIPAGMELFSAGDKSQMDVIKRWIDESDIYLLILGGRYGSIEPKSEKSYIELEYDYAIEKKKPFFACVIDEAKLKNYKMGSEYIEQNHPEKLTAFRKKVLSRMSKLWLSADQIQLGIMEALSEFSRREDLKGWIREPEDYSSIKEMIRLSSENAQLRQRNEECNGREATDRFYQFVNHEQAFERVNSLICAHIERDKPDHIELKFMAVAMRYSFPYIRNTFIEIADKNQNVNFLCKFSFTNYKHLARLSLDKTDCDWADEAETLTERLLKVKQEYIDKCDNESRRCNLLFEISVFDEIPQRHGILLKLDEEHLFLSVSDWDMGAKSGYPRLTVGTNLYRHHDSTRKEGRYWINLFKHWFLFYQKYQDFITKK